MFNIGSKVKVKPYKYLLNPIEILKQYCNKSFIVQGTEKADDPNLNAYILKGVCYRFYEQELILVENPFINLEDYV